MSLINIEKTIELDVYDHDTTPSVIKTIQMDTGTRTVYAVIQNSRQDYDIGQNATVSLTVLRPDKTKVQITGQTFISHTGTDGTMYGAKAELSDVALAVKGNLKAQFKITSGEQELRTEIFTISNGEALDAGDGDWAGDLDGHNLDEMAESIETLQTDMAAVNEDVSDLKEDFTDIINSTYVTDSASGSVAHFVDGADDVPMKSVKVNIAPVQSGSGDPSPSNVRPISGWNSVNVYVSPTTDSEDATVYNISLSSAGTVYGGTFDVVSGELTVDKKMIIIDGSNYALGVLINVYNNRYCYRNTYLGGIIEKNLPSETTKACCNILQSISRSNATSAPNGIFQYHGDNDELRFLFPLEDAYSTPDNIYALGLECCIPLANPLTYQLSATEIKSLLGINNVWSDAGDMDVEYRADTKLYIDKRLGV